MTEQKLVPVEPTEAMMAAVRPINGRKVWSAMLAAAPDHIGEAAGMVAPAQSGESFTSLNGLWKDLSLTRLERVKAHRSEFGSNLKTAIEAVDEEAERQRIALRATPASPPAETGEVGWLIESDDNGPLYQRASGTTRTASEALRFSRKQDAEAYIKAHGPNHLNSVATPTWNAVEHRWG